MSTADDISKKLCHKPCEATVSIRYRDCCSLPLPSLNRRFQSPSWPLPSRLSTPVLTARDRTLATWRNLALWTLQGWIAMFFIAAGYAKLTESMDNLVTLMGWPALVSEHWCAAWAWPRSCSPSASWRRWCRGSIGRPLLVVAAAGLVVAGGCHAGRPRPGGDIGLAVDQRLAARDHDPRRCGGPRACCRPSTGSGPNRTSPDPSRAPISGATRTACRRRRRSSAAGRVWPSRRR